HENGCCVCVHDHEAMKAEIRLTGLRVTGNDDGRRDVWLRRIVLVIDKLRQHLQVYVLRDEHLLLIRAFLFDLWLDGPLTCFGVAAAKFTDRTTQRHGQPELAPAHVADNWEYRAINMVKKNNGETRGLLQFGNDRSCFISGTHCTANIEDLPWSFPSNRVNEAEQIWHG